MCEGRRLVADFVLGTDARPGLPELAEERLTTTVDGLWVVLAYKLARQKGDRFVPLTGGAGYPADAMATCKFRRSRGDHNVPDPMCTCGFHALSSRKLPGLPVGHPAFRLLTVALSGRVLAFEWAGGGMLWRAERQTVVRVERQTQVEEVEWSTPVVQTPGFPAQGARLDPGDPDGRTAAVRPVAPRDSGPIRLDLPASCPVLEMWDDDAGWCVGASTLDHAPASLVLV